MRGSLERRELEVMSVTTTLPLPAYIASLMGRLQKLLNCDFCLLGNKPSLALSKVSVKRSGKKYG
jgi:hypothetical protein